MANCCAALDALEDEDGDGRSFSCDSGHPLTADEWEPFASAFDYNSCGLLIEIDRGLGVAYEIASATAKGLQTSPAISSVRERQASITGFEDVFEVYQFVPRARLLSHKSDGGSLVSSDGPLETWTRTSHGQAAACTGLLGLTTLCTIDSSSGGPVRRRRPADEDHVLRHCRRPDGIHRG